ncbi:MAG TPA: phenylacetate--CoA ligase, partial [Verrucomicrobiae bacterium]|nr:phenylacetate--CoA ligase [Verrucomicrobiae bacterium]
MMFWDEKAETIERGALVALQLTRLQATVRRVARKVPRYHQKFAESRVRPRDIRSLADLRRLPFTTNIDLRDTYPAGLLTVTPDEVLRLHTSSGTTGKPKALFFTAKDVNNAAELMARCLVMTGVT